MAYRIVAGIIAALLLVIYMAPVVLKLKDVALWAVAMIGIAMMLVDLWESLKEKD